MLITKKKFLSKVRKQRNGCWFWCACIGANGYGVIRINWVLYYAHRLAWSLFRGEIPKGMFVLHNCPKEDHRNCVNPDHLFLGTHLDNMADAVKKNRFQPQGQTLKRLWKTKWRFTRFGENQPNHKLTDEKVIEMRRLHAEEGWGYKRLHKHFNISFGVAQSVINRKSWKHVR